MPTWPAGSWLWPTPSCCSGTAWLCCLEPGWPDHTSGYHSTLPSPAPADFMGPQVLLTQPHVYKPVVQLLRGYGSFPGQLDIWLLPIKLSPGGGPGRPQTRVGQANPHFVTDPEPGKMEEAPWLHPRLAASAHLGSGTSGTQPSQWVAISSRGRVQKPGELSLNAF